jgi:hypothetical protein
VTESAIFTLTGRSAAAAASMSNIRAPSPGGEELGLGPCSWPSARG